MKKINNLYKIAMLLFIVTAAISCSNNDGGEVPKLIVSTEKLAFEPIGGSLEITVDSNAKWKIENASSWVKTDILAGDAGVTKVVLTAGRSTSIASNTVTIRISADNGQARRVIISQAPDIYPSFNTDPIPPDPTGMGSTATEINAGIKLGINIWNTMETPYGEEGWGNPKITQNLIDVLKSGGFNAIRIPCQYWVSHADKKTGIIDPVWLNRLKEVVQYCVNDGMYVMVNDHHDGFSDFKATSSKLDSIKAIQRIIWEQVATKLRDFDEKVMFASNNEPDAKTLTEVTNLYDFHQIFIKAVRSTGGKNAYRTLVIQAPNTSLDLATFFSVGANPGLPVDTVPNKLILEFHWYSPPNFCILGGDASWGKEWRYWGKNYHSLTDPTHSSSASMEEGYMESTLQLARQRFVDKGIPLLMGEFGVQYHADHCPTPADSLLSLKSTAHFYGHLVRTARANKISPFLWAGVINRGTETLDNRRDLDSLRVAAGLSLMTGKQVIRNK
ncbi:aryl-phospho-beta-D-glucosidase BglC (GH1 family) [Flavobacterium sp. 1]|uniref:cellulase family glycosylhydrolase n=1 Tax=Flavobacterium sp. 1 TaxID=2035200 RepID=UPI000C25095F|nr:cellulase family glycosylhydrolase [Flavobacterium sp. 1]PJJ08146.1 aryl-phospho-beta-D-glucosidase BglC (GH1 family) [Flavobacterium sp. 1]